MYRKNVSGQFICFQGVDASTGGIKSGVTWTVRRSIDGTFAAGGGTVTEDGTTGWYKYAMAQADTNGNDISFNFTGSGAVPQTVNIVTTAADPTDSVRFGLTALPNAAAGANGGLPVLSSSATTLAYTVTTVTSVTNRVTANTDQLGGSTQSATDLKDFADTGYNPTNHSVVSVSTLETDAISGNSIQDGSLTNAKFAGDLVVFQVSGSVGSVLGNVNGNVAGSVGTVSNPASIWDLSNGIETGLTPRQALRLIAAAEAGLTDGAGTGTFTIGNAVAQSKTRITATLSDNNRTVITYDLT